MRRKLLSAAGLTAILLLASSPVLFAQRTTGAISGVVKDSSGAALPGVTASVTGPNIVNSQTSTSGSDGFYRLGNLPPGEYQLSFTMTGFKPLTRKNVRVSLGSAAEENVTLEIGQMQEAVEVTAEASVVDTTSNQVGANFDRHWVENAPVKRNSFFDLVAEAPGSLQGEGGSGSGPGRTMVYGSSYDENSFQVDGVDITDNYFNEALAQPNVDAIDQVEVLSLGAPAEYGNLTGAVYNIVTRQGTNEFHGDVNFFWQGDGLTSDNSSGIKNPDGTFLNTCADDPTKRCPWKRDGYDDFTAQLGGPLIKDKLWFFASYQNQRDSFFDVSIPDSNELYRVRNYKDRFFGKLNWQLSPKHKLVATFHLDKGHTDNGLGLNSAPTTAWTRTAKTPTPGLAYTGVLSDKTVVDVRYSGFYGDVSGGPTDPSQPKNLTRFIDNDTGYISGGHYYWYELQPKRNTVTAKVSHLADKFLGSSHDFKFGVQYSDAVAKGIYGYNNLVYTYSLTNPGYGYGIARQPFSYSGNSRNLGVFLDDTVRVNSRLTLNLGIRYDHDKAYSAQQGELDANGNPTGVVFPETDFYTWTPWSPRLGFNLRLTADGKTSLKGHWGRYHRAVATGEYANVIGPNVKPYFAGGYDTATNEFTSLTQISSNTNLHVDPDYKSPYTDQYILSLERELAPGFGGFVNYVHKTGADIAAWSEREGTYVQIPFTDDIGQGATGNTFPIYKLVTDPADRQFYIENSPEQHSDVNAVSFGVTRPMKNNLSFNASAVWLRATGTLQEGQGGAGEQGSGVGITQRGGLQFRNFGRNPNQFVNADGRLRSDVEWQVKSQAVYQLPRGFLVSGAFSYRSGAWLIRRYKVPGTITNIPDNNVLLLQPRGDNGRIQSVTLVDLRLEKDFKLGKTVRLGVFADVLNLLNNSATQTVQSTIPTSSVFWFPADPVDPRRAMLGTKLRF
jgi:outer membrane receptor protein involved in Fe transport